MSQVRSASVDVVVIGAGIVGAAIAYALSAAGLRVTVVERGGIAAGTSSRGEGNVLVSDKEPGAELDLALLSGRLWRQFAVDTAADFELEQKGGLIVAPGAEEQEQVLAFAERQRRAGVDAQPLDARGLQAEEPHLASSVGGVIYPEDMQLQPIKATAALIAAAIANGCELRLRTTVTEILRDSGGAVAGVGTPAGPIAAGAVVDAAGPWSAEVTGGVGIELPVRPRRGQVLVTEPLRPMIAHKVYSASYLGDVADGGAELAVSCVIEATPAGPVLIGASREMVGFDTDPGVEGVRRIAAEAVRLFPFLERVRLLRTYFGFRPFCRDHLPIIGPDPQVEGLWHATGHEGAGIGLAPATGAVIAAGICDSTPPLDPEPFAPGRFTASAASRQRERGAA